LANIELTGYHDVLIIFPSGFQTVKKIDSRKAIYDLLIELSLAAKLIPTNYTLKLFANDIDHIDYTPNQTIGQLNPMKIKVIPKTATLKHKQLSISELPNNSKKNSLKNNNNNTSNISTSNLAIHESSKATLPFEKPFELTIRVDVSLPFNQRTVVRVKPDISLEDLFSIICKDAALDKTHYDLLILDSCGDNDINDDGSERKKRLHISMNDSFESYQTKQVTLCLKGTTPINVVDSSSSSSSPSSSSNKSLNSKSSHTLYTQNVLKARTQPKSYFNSSNKNSKQIHAARNSITNQLNENEFDHKALSTSNRSKSELDLNATKSKSNNTNTSISSSKSKENNNKMFGFFRKHKDKKDSDTLKSRNSNNNKTEAEPVVVKDQIESRAVIANEYYTPTNTKTKKRTAPAPPTPQQKPFVETPVAAAAAAPPQAATAADLDPVLLEKFFTKKKSKAPAPPPPPFSLPESPSPPSKAPGTPTSSVSNCEESTANYSHSNKIFSLSIGSDSASPQPSMSSASASPSLSEMRVSTERIKVDSPITITTTATFSEAQETIHNNNNNEDSTISTMENLREAEKNSFKKSTDYESNDINDSSVLSLMTTTNTTITTAATSFNSSLNTIEDVAKSFEKTITIGERYLKKYEQTLIHNHIEHSSNFNAKLEENQLTEETPIDSLPMPDPTYNSTNNNLDQKDFSEDEFCDIDSLKIISKSPLSLTSMDSQRKQHPHHHRPTTIIIGGNNTYEIKQNLSSSSETTSLILDTRIPNVLIKSPVAQTNLHEVLKSGRDEVFTVDKETATVKIKVASPTSDTIYTPEITHSPDASSPKKTTDVVYRQKADKVKSLPSSSSSSLSPQSSSLILESLNITPNVLRAISSPPPQFPAIGSNDLNVLHQNYTVIRSGDIIEKNGTYYSSDGTVRGYSGTVRKIANSTTLNEVFLKQRELEQQHEREYELELSNQQRKQDEEEQHRKILEQTSALNNLKQQQQQQKQNQNHVAKITNYNNYSNSGVVVSNSNKNSNRFSLGNGVPNERKSNTNSNMTSTLSSNSNIFKQAPFKRQNFTSQSSLGTNQPSNHHQQEFSSPSPANRLSKVDNELSKKLQDRRDSLESTTPTHTTPTTARVTVKNLEIDTNLKHNNYSTSSNSSASPPSLTSTMISPEASSSSSSSSSSSTSAPPPNRITKQIVNTENNLKRISKDPHSSSSSSTSSQSSIYSTVNSTIITKDIDIISQNKNTLLKELKSLIPVLDEAKQQDLIPSPPPPPTPPPLLIVNNGHQAIGNKQPVMTTFLPSKVAKAAAHTNSSSSLIESHHATVNNNNNNKMPPPMVASKPNLANNDSTKKQKQQILTMREGLMDSIKGFDASNLRKISNN
jgi:hypothetical protein